MFIGWDNGKNPEGSLRSEWYHQAIVKNSDDAIVTTKLKHMKNLGWLFQIWGEGALAMVNAYLDIRDFVKIEFKIFPNSRS
jgi:hypothetical protein